MSDAAIANFDEVAVALEQLGARRAKMMGRPMLALERRMFACLEGDRLALKLGAGTPEFDEAMAIPGAELFSRGASNRRFTDWVAIPAEHSDRWEEFAVAALHRLTA